MICDDAISRLASITSVEEVIGVLERLKGRVCDPLYTGDRGSDMRSALNLWNEVVKRNAMMEEDGQQTGPEWLRINTLGILRL